MNDERLPDNEKIDEASLESFPASDPPAYVFGRDTVQKEEIRAPGTRRMRKSPPSHVLSMFARIFSWLKRDRHTTKDARRKR